MWLLLVVCLGCQRPEPAPLPPPQRAQWRPRGRVVAASDGLRGYLVKPQDTPAPATLMLVDALDEATRADADALAISGTVAFAVTADITTTRAAAYLEQLPDTRGVTTDCRREAGC